MSDYLQFKIEKLEVELNEVKDDLEWANETIKDLNSEIGDLKDECEQTEEQCLVYETCAEKLQEKLDNIKPIFEKFEKETDINQVRFMARDAIQFEC